MFNHPDVTEEFIKLNEGNLEKQDLCRKISIPGYEVLNKLPSPRFIKSHFPLSLLPGILDVGCKIVYVARNPKDVAVSWYHLNRAIKTQGYQGNFEQFWDYFQNNLSKFEKKNTLKFYYFIYFLNHKTAPWSPYWEHLKEAWAQRNHPNLLFIFYEEMQQVLIYKYIFKNNSNMRLFFNIINFTSQDFFGAIKKIAKFLGKSYTNKQIWQLTEYLDIKNFRNNPMVNSSELRDCQIITADSFVRHGQSGAWSNTFTAELEAKADAWILENLKETDLIFPCVNNNNVSIIN